MHSDSPDITTLNMHDLRARYHNCAASTIYRRIKRNGYPKPSRIGRDNLWSTRAVLAWEYKHMPELHAGDDTRVDAHDADEWNSLKGKGDNENQSDWIESSSEDFPRAKKPRGRTAAARKKKPRAGK